jgi:N-acetylmuramic acid 6-phosphate etherase
MHLFKDMLDARNTMAATADLAGLQTESRNSRSTDINNVTTLELCEIINDEDGSIPGIVKGCIPTIAQAIDALAPRVRQGGRVIYVGAGTSGRLGVLDASEIPPTYSAPPAQFVGLIAGGDVALRSAKEGAEDSWQGAVNDLSLLELDGDQDSLIGIASSGRTPYVLSCLAFAKQRGCVTIGIACSAPSVMSNSGHVDFMIEAVTGPEVVTGSTRMKAGTATKLVLNMLSTGTMIKVGKTFGNIVGQQTCCDSNEG